MADAFHAKVRAVRPTGLEGDLQAGVVFIAVLKHNKKPTDILEQSDLIWMRCQQGRKLAAACTAYKNLPISTSAKDLVFRHDFNTITGTEVASRLNWRQDSLVVIESVEASDLAARPTATPPVRAALRSIDTNASTIAQPLKSELEDMKPMAPKTDDGRLGHLHDIPAQAYQVQHENVLQQGPDQPPHPMMSDCGWVDFVCERRAFFQAQRPKQNHTAPAEVAGADASIRTEWVRMEQPGRDFFDARAPQIGPITGDWVPARCAFWRYYYDRLDVVRKSCGDPHQDFHSTQMFLNTVISEWVSMPASLKNSRIRSGVAHVRLVPISGPPVPTLMFTSTPMNMGNSQSASSRPNEMSEMPTAASTTQELPQLTRVNISELFADSSLEQLEAGVEKGVSILDELKVTLEALRASSVDAAQWLQSIDSVRNQAVKTRTIVGVVGQTGAGKSSVINALLEEERLVPTNCMRACTAVVCEISYNHEEIAYRAEIDFISADDWLKELRTLFQDLLDHEGKVNRESTIEDSEAGVAYAKLKSVYPKLTKEDMQITTPEQLMAHENVKCLGTLLKLEDNDSLKFYQKLQIFVDSKEKARTRSTEKNEKKKKGPREMEYWPLIKVVRIFTKAAALSTGAVLVDLPGVHDSNQARAAVAQGYLKQCTGLWIVAPITRAVDDKSAKNLLGDSFKRQLKLDGSYHSVTFICSKTDDISLMEATSSLGLEDEVSGLWSKIDAYENDIKVMEKQLEAQRESKRDVSAAIEEAEEELEVWEKLRDDVDDGKTAYHPKIQSAKRKRSANTSSSRKKSRVDDSEDEFIDNDSDDHPDTDNDVSDNESSHGNESRDPLTENDITAKIGELKAVKKNGRKERISLEEKMRDVKKQIDGIREQNDILKTKIATFCISGRNNYSRDAIRQDFAAGIKELDSEVAEEQDAANFDPEKDARDYDEVARSLPVYCVSSRAYQKLMGRLMKDADVPGFKDIVETEVPGLQAHCKKLTEAGREAACRRFLNSLTQLLNSLQLWTSGDGSGRKLTEGQLRHEELWLSDRLNKFDKSLERQIKQLTNRLTEELQDNVFEAFEIAAKSASTEAGRIVQHWGQKVDRENRAAGGLCWATYKATCRRDGVFRDIDFNEQLAEPIMKQIAGGWEKFFQRRVTSVLTGLPTLMSDIVQNAHQDIEGHAVRGGSSVASFHILQQSIPTYKELFKDAANTARTTITESQRNINREFTPVIAENMLDAYSGCVAEYGSGSYMRMKALMHRHVDIHRHKMFKESTNKVECLLGQLVEDVEKLLLAKADEVFHSIKRDYTRVVVGEDSSNTKQLPREQRRMRCDVLQTLEGSEHQFKIMLGIESDDEAEEAGGSVGADLSNGDMLRGSSTTGTTETIPIGEAALVTAVPSCSQGSNHTRDEEVETEHSMASTEESVDEDVEDHNRFAGLAVDGEIDSQEDDFSESQSSMESGSEVDYTSDES